MHSATHPSASPSPQPTGRPQLPSVHLRALATWLAIFPMVTVGIIFLRMVGPNWSPVLTCLVLTVVVVPLAVYLVVPAIVRWLMRLSQSLRR